MAHTYTAIMVHYVFSTHDRRRLITPKIQERVWAFAGGIAKENNIIPIMIGGTDDHMHVLAGLPPTVAVAKAIQLIKGSSGFSVLSLKLVTIGSILPI